MLSSYFEIQDELEPVEEKVEKQSSTEKEADIDIGLIMMTGELESIAHVLTCLVPLCYCQEWLFAVYSIDRQCWHFL